MSAPTIQNTTLTSADTEYEVDISSARKIAFQCRTSFAVRFAFVTGKVAGPTSPYGTVKADGTYAESLEAPGGLMRVDKLYLASSEAGVVVEILEWSA